MVLGERIRARLSDVGISQAELARRVGMSQSGLVNLIAGRSRETTFLHKIARELGTTPAYLTGETEDPHTDAVPPVSPMGRRVTLEVMLPSEAALARMFERLLEGIGQNVSSAEQALLLAQGLPAGLSQLRKPPGCSMRARRRAREATPRNPTAPDCEPRQ